MSDEQSKYLGILLLVLIVVLLLVGVFMLIGLGVAWRRYQNRMRSGSSELDRPEQPEVDAWEVAGKRLGASVAAAQSLEQAESDESDDDAWPSPENDEDWRGEADDDDNDEDDSDEEDENGDDFTPPRRF